MEGVDERSVSTFGSAAAKQKPGININPSSTTSYDSGNVDVPSHSPSVFINRWHALQFGHNNISPHKGGHSPSRSDSPLKIPASMQSSSPSLLVPPGEERTDFQKQVQLGLEGHNVDETMNNGDTEKKGKTSQTTMELENGNFNTGEELKKIMESGNKHVEIAFTDPKREKRLLANRQSAARSRERKSKYISELENKVKAFELEATTLSAQFTNLQKDHSELKRENNEYKLRLQAIQKLSQLKDALNQTLNDEVQRLRNVVAELGGDHTRQLAINQQILQFQHQESNQDIQHFPHAQENRQ